MSENERRCREHSARRPMTGSPIPSTAGCTTPGRVPSSGLCPGCTKTTSSVTLLAQQPWKITRFCGDRRGRRDLPPQGEALHPERQPLATSSRRRTRSCRTAFEPLQGPHVRAARSRRQSAITGRLRCSSWTATGIGRKSPRRGSTWRKTERLSLFSGRAGSCHWCKRRRNPGKLRSEGDKCDQGSDVRACGLP